MKIMLEKNKLFIFSLIIILITLNTSFLIQQEPFISTISNSKMEDIKIHEIKESANNDTVAPVITFVQPSTNNSVIKKDFYEITVNVSDDHPPVSGNVIIQISNISTSLFNATMALEGDELWFFNWENISSYPNYEFYKIEVWAKDSSLNGNNNWSRAYYVILNLSKKLSPGILNVAIYIFFVCIIFALILVYFRKKSAFIRTTEKK